MTRIMAKDLGRRGINVNCIAPGPTGTDLFLRGKSQQVIDALASSNPFNRLGEPDDIAKVFGFLASGKSAWINGQVLRVNGGMTVG
jgi:3-oxoacyl-[acyl-carrier protein] reductase